MSDVVEISASELVLPANVVSKVDVSRIVSELERVDNDLTTAAVRHKTGAEPQVQPPISDQLTDFLTQNNLTITTAPDRGELLSRLRALKDSLPVIHLTFAVEADRDSLMQIAQWLRSSVHPQAVIAVGLQPSLIAGVYVRTPNHVHDLSLRGMLADGHDILVKELEALRGSK